MKLVEENTEVNLHDLGFGNDFLDETPKTQKKKEINCTPSKSKVLCIKGHFSTHETEQTNLRMEENICK